jgi:hypothetical protein
MSRRRLFGVSGGVGLAAVLAFPARALAQGAGSGSGRLPQTLGALGADYDQNLVDIHYPELRAAAARWLRGFFPMPEADAGNPADNAAIQAIVAAGKRDYGTVLGLKFPYNNAVMPAPGSPEMALALARLDKVLPAVMDNVDILVIGNEPFIESLPADRGDPLNVFYETIADHVIAYRQAHGGPGSRTRLYMGALNRLDLPANQTAGTERWMAFARQTPELEGVDIHPHVPSPDAVQPFLDYILPRLRSDQTFLVTEFSLVWYWQAHLSDQVSAQFADRYGFARSTLVWQVIEASIQRPFTQEQWDYFLATSAWFQSQKTFLRDQVQRFRQTGRLAVATYAFRQGEPMVQNFGPDKTPWVLNSLFDNHTVQTQPDGLPGRTNPWFDDFRALQHG